MAGVFYGIIPAFIKRRWNEKYNNRESQRMDFGFTPKLTRIRVLHCEMELIFPRLALPLGGRARWGKKKSNDQRKPFG